MDRIASISTAVSAAVVAPSTNGMETVDNPSMRTVDEEWQTVDNWNKLR
ncbi:hypothetical protein [Arthrobacter livingstonensis]|nr:hypothetical protein [Arthrobacter livingstonensis]